MCRMDGRGWCFSWERLCVSLLLWEDLVTEATSPCRQTTAKANEQIYQKDDDQSQQHHEFDIFPPHAPLQRPTPDPKIACIFTQATRLVHQHTHVLAPLQHSLDILRHNLPDAFNLALRRAQGILLARLGPALLLHHLPERGIEARAAIGRQIGEIGLCSVEFGEEFLLEVGEEAKGDALAEVAFGDDEEG